MVDISVKCLRFNVFLVSFSEFCTSFVCTVFGGLSPVFGHIPDDSKLFTSLSALTSRSTTLDLGENVLMDPS